MNTAGRNEDWTGPQLAARLATLQGVAPEPSAFLVYRSTTRPDGEETQVFHTADEPGLFRQPALPGWLARHRLRGADRLGLSLLVIREVVDEAGLIRECTLERRRGAVDGPLHGDPARVEFTGPARVIRFYRVLRDGRLAEMPGNTDTLPTRHHAPEQLAGELAAVHAHFRPGAQVIDVREPTLFETMIGCDSIVHVRLANGREVGCGIGWHGPVPFVLAADFPRFSPPLALAPEDEAAVQAVLQREGLVRHETRLDAAGLAVVARRRGGEQLFLLRADDGAVRIETYEPAPGAAASDDQASWMRYAETYEHLAMLDAWRDGASEDLLVISGEASGQIWRHHIDRDGVETWRKPDETAAAGLLYRERLQPGTLAAADAAALAADSAESALPAQAEARETPADSLLGKAEAYVIATAALREARDAAAEAASLPDILVHLRALTPALKTLGAEQAAAEVRTLAQHAEEGRIQPPRLASALARIATHLPEELAATRLLMLAPAQWRLMANPAPFGRAVEDAFPEAAYDIEEAALCLAFRRPTAAAFHCLRIIEAGLSVLDATLSTGLLGADRRWTRIMALLRQAAGETMADLPPALDQVRRCWRGARLSPPGKYTEAEAERLFAAVSAFMRALAETQGEQAGTTTG